MVWASNSLKFLMQLVCRHAPCLILCLNLQCNAATDFMLALNDRTEPVSVTAPADSVDLLDACVTDRNRPLPRYCVAHFRLRIQGQFR